MSFPRVVGCLALGSLALVACAPGGGRAAAATEAKPTGVRVTISEGAIVSTQTAFVAGVPYSFIVSNKGGMNHEFLVMPPVRPGSMSHEAMWGLALGAIYERDLPAGGIQVTTIVFEKAYPAGTLELACHILGHYEAGQRLPIVVQPERPAVLPVPQLTYADDHPGEILPAFHHAFHID